LFEEEFKSAKLTTRFPRNSREERQTETFETLLKEEFRSAKLTTRIARIEFETNKVEQWIPRVCITTLNIARKPGKMEVRIFSDIFSNCLTCKNAHA
jgi:hypothetical protein